MRDGIYVDPEVIPMVESRGTSRINKGSLLMNAAVLDFQRSSSQVAVMKWTGLNYKELWEVLLLSICCQCSEAGSCCCSSVRPLPQGDWLVFSE